MKNETEELVKLTTKIIKPYLRYFRKCTFPREEDGKCFHIIGVDVIYDEKLRPWLLELNSGPSLSIEFDPEDYLETKRKEPLISPIDLHVKSAIVKDAVKLCKKPIKEIISLEKLGTYKKIFDPESEPKKYKIMDKLVDIFFDISGARFFSSLSMTKFNKIIKYIKNVGPIPLKKIDLEIAFKKVQGMEGAMDFYGFMIALDMVLEVAYTKNLEVSKKLRLEKLISKFEANK